MEEVKKYQEMWDGVEDEKVLIYPCECSTKFFINRIFKKPMMEIVYGFEKEIPVKMDLGLDGFLKTQTAVENFISLCEQEKLLEIEKDNAYYYFYPTSKLRRLVLINRNELRRKIVKWTEKEKDIRDFTEEKLISAYWEKWKQAIPKTKENKRELRLLRRFLKEKTAEEIKEIIGTTIVPDGWWIEHKAVRTVGRIFEKLEKLESSLYFAKDEKERVLPSCLSSETIKSFENTFVYDLEMANKIMESLDEFPFQRKNRDSIIDVLEKASIFMSGIYKMAINIDSFDDDYTVVSFENIFSYYLEEINGKNFIYNGDFLLEKMVDCLNYVLEFNVVYFGKRIEECSNTRLKKPVVDGKQIEIWGKFKEVSPDRMIESFGNFVNGKIDDWAKIIMKAYKSLSENNGYLIDDETGKKGFFNEFYKN